MTDLPISAKSTLGGPQTPRSRPTRISRLLSVAEAAHYMRVSRKTVRRKSDGGELRASQVGVQCRFLPEDIEAYLVRNASRLSIGVQ